MTTRSYNRQIHDIYTKWSENLITTGEKQRLVQAAEDAEVAECQKIMLAALAEASYRLPRLAALMEDQGYSPIIVSSSIVRLLNAHIIGLTPGRYVYRNEVA